MIKALYLRNFRNYEEQSFYFSEKMNVIFGNNGQGKTNLLEALYLFINARSFRSSHLTELIHFGSSAFYLELFFEKHGVEQVLKFSFSAKERAIVHNYTPLPYLSSLVGLITGVLLSPEDRSLLKGGPAQRRQFLDLLLSQASPLYLHHLMRYLRAMKQRNVLLKKRSLQTIEIWEEQMTVSAAYIVRNRLAAVEELGALCQSEELAGEPLQLSYLCAAADKPDIEGYFLKEYARLRKREQELGMTLTGPHRDDLLFLMREKDARYFASEGEQRSCIAALKLAQWKWLAGQVDHTPLFCIDDIGISFDSLREQKLYERLEQLGQVFITHQHRTNQKAHAIHIHKGTSVALSHQQF